MVKNNFMRINIIVITLAFLGLLFLGGLAIKAAPGENPQANVSIVKTKVGSGVEPPTGVFITTGNGFSPGVDSTNVNPNGDILASGDEVNYKLTFTSIPAGARKVSYQLNIPSYLTFIKGKNVNICASNIFLTGKFNDSTLTCTYTIKEGASASIDTTIVLTAKDTAGTVQNNQVLTADVGVAVGPTVPTFIPFTTSRAEAISVISAPLADLMIRPSQCHATKKECENTIYTNTSGSFDLIPKTLRYLYDESTGAGNVQKGYNNTFGATSMTPYTAQVDVSNFPANTVWKIGSTVLTANNGILNIPESTGTTTITFTVPDDTWGGDEFSPGETRSYDVHLIVPDTAFASASYLNNGNGWEPGQGEGQDYYTEKEQNMGAELGWYYNNNDWTKYVVYKPIPGEPGSETPDDDPINISKYLQRPWNPNQTLWEDGNMSFSSPNSSRVNTVNKCVFSMCPDQVTPGTEFTAIFSVNINDIDEVQMPITLSDTWDPSQVELLSIEDISNKLQIGTTEWLVGSNWQTSSTPVAGASAIKLTFTGENAVGNNTVKLNFKVKNDIDITWGKTTISDTASATYNNGKEIIEIQSQATLRTPNIGNKTLGLTTSVWPDYSKGQILPKINRVAQWKYYPQVRNLESSTEAVTGTFTIALDPAILSLTLTNSAYEIEGLQLGDFKTNTRGELKLKLKGDSYLGPVVGSVMNLPTIEFDTDITVLVNGDVKTSTQFDAYGLTVDAGTQVYADNNEGAGAELATSTPQVGVNQPLKYQYIMVSAKNGVEDKPLGETILILPTQDNALNSAYLAEFKNTNPSYSGVSTSEYAGTYTASATIDQGNSTSSSQLMCTTNPNPSMDINDSSITWQDTCDSDKVTAYKVIVDKGVNEGIVVVDIDITPSGNETTNNYLIWASPVYIDGVKTPAPNTKMAQPANDVVVSSQITGNIYWDDSEYGGVLTPDKDGIKGVDVQLIDANGNVVNNAQGVPYKATTDENGVYIFNDVLAGNYKVNVISAPVKKSSYYAGKDINGKISYSYENKRGSNSSMTSTPFEVQLNQTFSDVNFGFFGPDPYTNIMKVPSSVQCVGDEIQCNIQWDILIKGGTSTLIPGQIKLMYVQGDVNTVVVTEDNAVYVWGANLGYFDVGQDSSTTPLKLNTDVIGDGEQITQVTGSYSMIQPEPSSGADPKPTQLTAATLMFLTQSGTTQNVYGIGFGAYVTDNSGNKFGTGNNKSFTTLTKLNDISNLQTIIDNNGSIITIQSDSCMSLILMENGKVYITGDQRSWATNTIGSAVNTWTPINIVDGTGKNLFNDVKIKEIVSSNWLKTLEPESWGWNDISNSITAIDTNGNLYTAGKSQFYSPAQYTNGTGTALVALTLNDEVSNIKEFRNYYDSNIAIDGNGDIYVWGKNKYGMLGNGIVAQLQGDRIQANILKLQVNFKAKRFLTSITSISNSCNIIEDTDGNVQATGNCVLPNGETINYSTFTNITGKFNVNDANALRDFVALPTNGISLNNDGLLLPVGSASNNSYKFQKFWDSKYRYANASYYPVGLPTTTDQGVTYVDGPWVTENQVPVGEAGSVDITGLKLNDAVSSQVYDVQAQLFSMPSTELNPTETDLGFISPNSTNTLANNFTNREFNLPTLERDLMFKVTLSGKINRTEVGQVIGNQAWITSNELPREVPTINSLPGYTEGDYGKWTGNEGSACGINTDWTVNTDNQNNCDQVYATVDPSNISLGSLGGIAFWDKDNDGTFNNNDIKLPNIPVYLLQVDSNGVGTVINNTVTGADGSYLFDSLDPSLVYQVSFQLPTQKPGDIDPTFPNLNSGWSFTKQINEACSVELESCVTNDGLTPNLTVVANVKVGDNTVNAGVVTITPKVSVTKQAMDVDNVSKQTINAIYNTPYNVTVSITNDGEEALQSFIFNDQTTTGSNVTWASCTIPGGSSNPIDITGGATTNNNYEVTLPEEQSLTVGATMTCEGTLPGLQSSADNHTDTVTVIGFGSDTGVQVNGVSNQFEATLDETTFPAASITLENGILTYTKNDGVIDGSKKLFNVDQSYVVTFRITNDGKQDVMNLNLDNITNQGPAITDITCQFPSGEVSGNTVSMIKQGEFADCQGNLNLPEYNMIHLNSSTATANGVIDGSDVQSNVASFEAYTLKEAIPVAPTLDKDVPCGVDYKVIVETGNEGVTYQVDTEGKIVTVTATAKDGYEIRPGTTVEWKLDVTNETLCAGVEVPTLDKNVPCGVDYNVIVPQESTSVIYEVTKNDKTVTVTATAKDGYAFEEGIVTEWTFNIENETSCAIIVEPTLDKDVECNEDYKVIVPKESTSVKYEVSKNGKTVIVTATAKDGYEFEPNTITKWTFNVENDTLCATVEVPTLDKDVPCEVDYKVIVPQDSDSVKYEVSKKGKKVTVKAIAKDGYAFEADVETEWTFDITNPEKCLVNPPEGPDPKEPTEGLKPLPGTGTDNTLLVVSLLISLSASFVYVGRRFILNK